MGTPIRKCVGEQFDSCLDMLKTEIQARLEEGEASSQEEDSDEEDEEVFLPIMNASLYQKMEQQLNDLQKNKQMDDYAKLAQKMSCSNHVSSALTTELFCGISRFSKEIPTPTQVIQVVKSSFVRGLLHGGKGDGSEPAERMGAFVSLFLNAWCSSSKVNVNLFDLIKELRSFVGQVKTIIASDFSLIKGMNLKVASDYGRLFGYLIMTAVIHPQEFIESMSLLQYSDSDDSSDEEEVVQIKRKKQLSKLQFKAVQKKAKAEATRLMSVWFNTLSLCDTRNAVVAGTTYELVSTLLFENNDLRMFSIRNEGKKKRIEKDLADILVSAMEMSSIAQKSDLPSSSLIADGKRRCRLIKAWAERSLKTASVKREASSLSLPEDMEERREEKEELTKNEDERKCLFVLDATPSKSGAELDDKIDHESLSEEIGEHESVDKEKKSNASLAVSNSDGKSIFVLDSKPVATTLSNQVIESSTEDEPEGKAKHKTSPPAKEGIQVKDMKKKKKNKVKKDTPRKQMQSTPVRKSRKNSSRASTLAPVPESEAATTPIDFTVQNSETPKPRRSTRKRSMSISSDAEEDVSIGTPTRMTRSRRRSLSVTSIEPSSDVDEMEAEQVVTRRRTRSRGMSMASEGDASELNTPVKRSKRKSQNESETPSKTISTPLRRSVRKKR